MRSLNRFLSPCCLNKFIPKSQLISKHQFIFDTWLDNFLLQCTIKSNFTGFNIIYFHACIDYLSIIPDLRLLHSLEKLNKQLFDLIANRSIFESWWQTKHLTWVEELNTTISYYRNIQSHYYNDLSNTEILQLYYDTNTFLIDYLECNQKLTIVLRRKN